MYILKINKNKNKVYLCYIRINGYPVIIEPVNKMWHTGSYQAFPVDTVTVLIGLSLCSNNY